MDNNIKKRIRIAFSDFNKDFDQNHNFIMDMLQKRYDVELIIPKNDEERQRVDYLFYSYFGKEFFGYQCIRIFVTGENICPDFNLCDYAIGFEHMSFEDRYIRYPIFLWDIYREDYLKATAPRENVVPKDPQNRKFCSVVVSNNYLVEPSREEIFRKISEYKRVDSGGRAFNNIGIPEGVKDKAAFISGYKFNIAYENSIYSGYTTEKIVQAFAAGTIPIYAGDPRVDELFNPESFINANHLTSDQVVRMVKEIDQDEKAYLKMLFEPSLLDSDYSEKKDEELRSWFYHIFDQDITVAYRRAKYGKIPAYEDNQRKKDKMEKMIKKHQKVYKTIKKMVHI